MHALILGGYGASGAGVARLLAAEGHRVTTAGRDRDRADRVVDLRDGPHALAGVLGCVDVVVNAAGIEDPRLAEAATDAGVAFVDITASAGYVEALERLEPPAPVLLSVGLAPGLTNMLAHAAHGAGAGRIDLALVVGAGERHGRAGVAWAFGLLGRSFVDPATRAPVRNYTQPARFDLPGLGRRRLYRADYSDQHTLTRDLGIPVRTWFGLDSRAATAMLAVLARTPGGRHAPRGLPTRGSDRWLAVARGDTGRDAWATGRGQAHATAVVTALAAARAGDLAPGAHHLHRIATLADIPADSGIEVHVP
jgi:saccharopine dehydrogenase-like NADP-dependent oxidoreductase